LLLVLGILAVAFQAQAEESRTLKTQLDLVNYGIGVETARNLKNSGLTVDVDLLIKGLKDGLSGGVLLVSEKELRGSIVSFQSELRRKQALGKKLAVMDNVSSGIVRGR